MEPTSKKIKMAGQMKQQINEDNNFSKLLRSIDPSLDLLGRLTSVSFIKDRIPSVIQQSTVDGKNFTLLNALLEASDDIEESVMNDFISALRLTGQHHVANIFHRECEKVSMSDEHYELLSTKRRDICQFMNVRDRLADYLVSLKILSETDMRKILCKKGLNDMAEETVNILMRKSDCAFDKFVNVLNVTDQSHVSYILTGVGNLPMSDEHRKLLHAKMRDLERFTDTENGLIDPIIITNHDAEQIRSENGLNAMARKLVEILRRKSDDTFCKFVTLLRENGQSHVAYILTGEDKKRPLKEEHRQKLLSGPRQHLVNTIDSKHSRLISALMSKGVLSSYDEQRVTSVQPDTHEDRNEMILNLIARKSQTDFFKFISALRDTKQTHVAIKLIGADIVAKIKTVYESGTNNVRIAEVDLELVEYMRDMFLCDREMLKELSENLSSNGVSVSGVHDGCIAVTFTCKSPESLRNLRDLNESGKLQNLINKALCSRFEEKGLQSLKVEISNKQFDKCAQKFASWILMTSEHRKALLLAEERLVDKMTINDDLLDKLSLSPRRREAIESASTREQQVKTLIDIVSRQPDSAFSQLINALNDTQQTEAAGIINGRDNISPTNSENSELHKAQATGAWREVDYNLEYLLHCLTMCLCPTPVSLVADMVMSFHNLKQQYSMATSRPYTIDTEMLPFPTQTLLSFRPLAALSHDPGK